MGNVSSVKERSILCGKFIWANNASSEICPLLDGVALLWDLLTRRDNTIYNNWENSHLIHASIRKSPAVRVKSRVELRVLEHHLPWLCGYCEAEVPSDYKSVHSSHKFEVSS